MQVEFKSDNGNKILGPFKKIELKGDDLLADGQEIAFFDRDTGQWFDEWTYDAIPLKSLIINP